MIAAGAFTGIGASGRNLVAALDPGSGRSLWPPEDPLLCTNAAPDCLPGVQALAVSGSTIFAGGFGQNGRGTLAAIDAGSGATLAWTPDPVGAVCALAASESTLFVGGDFRSIAGEPHAFLAAIALAGTVPVTVAPPHPAGRPHFTLRGARPNP